MWCKLHSSSGLLGLGCFASCLHGAAFDALRSAVQTFLDALLAGRQQGLAADQQQQPGHACRVGSTAVMVDFCEAAACVRPKHGTLCYGFLRSSHQALCCSLGHPAEAAPVLLVHDSHQSSAAAEVIPSLPADGAPLPTHGSHRSQGVHKHHLYQEPKRTQLPVQPVEVWLL